MKKILLDTDIGGDIDDALCLAYLLKEPACDLVGITTVCGEPEKRAAVAQVLCHTVGKDIPIVAGTDTFLWPNACYPTPEGAPALAHWEHSLFKKGDAPAFLYQKIQESPGQVYLIAIGNMTNVAQLFWRFPRAINLLAGLIVMNGYFGKEELPAPWYNWNSWVDPLASRVVFSARTAIHRVIPLNITAQLTRPVAEAGSWFKQASRLGKAIMEFGGAWMENEKTITFHDPLAAVSLFHPVCQFETGSVQVALRPEIKQGATTFSPQPDGPLEVAWKVDADAFFHILRGTICR